MKPDDVYEILNAIDREEMSCEDVPDECWDDFDFCAILINNDWDCDYQGNYYLDFIRVLDNKSFWITALPNYLEGGENRETFELIPNELWEDDEFKNAIIEIYPEWKDHYEYLVSEGIVKPQKTPEKTNLAKLFENRNNTVNNKSELSASPKGEASRAPTGSKNPEDWRLYGVECNKQGKYDEALQAHAKALELDPNNARVHSNIGAVHYNQKNYNSAIAAFTKAIELCPGEGQLPYAGAYYENRAIVYEAMGEYEKARLDYHNIIMECDMHYEKAFQKMNDLYIKINYQKAAPPPLPIAPAWQNLEPVQYYVGINNQQAGPFGWAELDGLVKKGDLTKQSLVWKAGFADWKTASDVDELKVIFG